MTVRSIDELKAQYNETDRMVLDEIDRTFARWWNKNKNEIDGSSHMALARYGFFVGVLLQAWSEDIYPKVGI